MKPKIHKRIPVEEVRIGMYVVDLDRPWLDTAFKLQGFPVTTGEQIDALKSYCKSVYIDLEYDPASADDSLGEASTLPLRGTEVYPETTPLEKEVTRAREIFFECQQTFVQSFDDLRATQRLDAQRLRSAVSSMTDSVLRNPDAMLLLAKLERKGQYELTRALDTSVLMITFGRFLQQSRERIELLGLAGLLLDVGKVKIPDAILKKRDVLSPEEYEVAKTHVTHSADIIRADTSLRQEVVDVVLLHHERHNGSGYPRGLRGGEISLEGSVASLTDCYSALTSERPYTDPISPSNALSALYKQRGELFHGALVEQFIQCVGIYPVGSVVELNTGEIGIVLAQNLARRLQPRVMVILDPDMKPLNPQKVLDLLKDPKATADEPYRIRRTLPADKLPINPRDFFL